MKERPILFSAPMVKALLSLQKTQTRRALKWQPPCDPAEDEVTFPFYWGAQGTYSGVSEPRHYWTNFEDQAAANEADRDTLYWPGGPDSDHDYESDVYGSGGMESPYGSEKNCMKPAARLWVREAFTLGSIPVQLQGAPQLKRGPMLDEQNQLVALYEGDDHPGGWFTKIRRTSPIFMPRWASRITLEITDIRVERLQAISEVDAIDEGVMSMGMEWLRPLLPEYFAEADRVHAIHAEMQAQGKRMGYPRQPLGPSPRERYALLWDQINGAGAWEANPWVWVVSFKRVTS